MKKKFLENTAVIMLLVCFAVFVMGCLTTPPSTSSSNTATSNSNTANNALPLGNYLSNVTTSMVALRANNVATMHMLTVDRGLITVASGTYRINGNKMTITYTSAEIGDLIRSWDYIIIDNTSFRDNVEHGGSTYTLHTP